MFRSRSPRCRPNPARKSLASSPEKDQFLVAQLDEFLIDPHPMEPKARVGSAGQDHLQVWWPGFQQHGQGVCPRRAAQVEIVDHEHMGAI